jgi:ATP-binding cassette subfamily C protein CydD
MAPGQSIALVGPSGAGKSTIASLLLGFIRPERGHIRVNDQDLNQLDLEDWRQQLAWLPQQPRLFQGTIADNIRLGHPQATDAAVRKAAEQARAAEFINRLPAGYNTAVGERGAGLSGGQIQRVALARAFLRDARLVILDEATASLDPASEALVQEAIDALAKARSMLVIAHRLSTVRSADRILVIDQGRIIEEGNHQALVEQGGHYQRMVALLGGADV